MHFSSLAIAKMRLVNANVKSTSKAHIVHLVRQAISGFRVVKNVVQRAQILMNLHQIIATAHANQVSMVNIVINASHQRHNIQNVTVSMKFA